MFFDPLARVFPDASRSTTEPRELIVGRSTRQRLLIVSFTERDGRVRIISARAGHAAGTTRP